MHVPLPNGKQLAYGVDARGRRISRSENGVVTHRWLFRDQLQPVAEVDESGAVTTRYVYATHVNMPDYSHAPEKPTHMLSYLHTPPSLVPHVGTPHTYDAPSRRTSTTLPARRVVNQAYDPAGRLSRTELPGHVARARAPIGDASPAPCHVR